MNKSGNAEKNWVTLEFLYLPKLGWLEPQPAACGKAGAPQEQPNTRKESSSHPAKSCKETICSKSYEMPNSQLISVSFKPWDLKESSGAAAVIINTVLMESGRYWCVSGKIFSLQAFWHQDSLFLSQHPSRALLKGFSANWKAAFSLNLLYLLPNDQWKLEGRGEWSKLFPALFLCLFIIKYRRINATWLGTNQAKREPIVNAWGEMLQLMVCF